MPRFVFCHGWGFDAAIWTPMIAAFGGLLDESSPAHLTDRGYFGSEPVDFPATAEPVIGITHSLGTMSLLQKKPVLSALIVINGFPRFTAETDYPHGVPSRILSRMQRRFEDDPRTVLTEFRARAGGASSPSPSISREKLTADLTFLATGDARAELATIETPILVLAATDDPIVTPALTEAAFADLANAEIIWSDDGGHGLPWRRADWCVTQIKRFLAD